LKLVENDDELLTFRSGADDELQRDFPIGRLDLGEAWLRIVITMPRSGD
jgi:hypothetical protein